MFTRQLILIMILLFPILGRADATWDVGIVFLGAKENEDFQKDIDENIVTVARTAMKLNIGILREFPDRVVEYFPDPKSKVLSDWSTLFQTLKAPGMKIPGDMQITPGNTASALARKEIVNRFFSHLYSNPDHRRLLIVYGHGDAYDGLTSMNITSMVSQLKDVVPSRGSQKPFDILWLESCFMANVEAAYQMRSLAPYLIASEDAQFSAGAPLDSLPSLIGKEADLAAVTLAQRYVESYSYVENGSKHQAAEQSSATISVIETSKLEKLVSVLKEFYKKVKEFRAKDRATYVKKTNYIRLQKKDLLDLGSFSVISNYIPLAEMLDYKDGRIQSTNPRLSLNPPTPGTLLIYGYNNWTRGDSTDKQVTMKLPKQLKSESYFKGNNQKSWPAITLKGRMTFSPFSVGLNTFNYFFVDPISHEMIGKEESFERKTDFYLHHANNPDNPILFMGYTQGIGSKAEIYSGLSIVDPMGGIPSLDYPELDFYTETGWGNF